MALFALKCTVCGRDVQVSLVKRLPEGDICYHCELQEVLGESPVDTTKEKPAGFLLGDD